MADLVALSLGAGVQSTTLLLMACAGEFERTPDVAIFADTGWEPQAVYDHLERLEAISTTPIVRVSAGNLRADLLGGTRFAAPPLYVRNLKGEQASLRRQCTKEYKIAPIYRHLQAIRGTRRVELWLGISREESLRMKDARVRYVRNRWPLIERGMSRESCVRWLAAHGHPTPPKSACIGCPYHDDRAWRRMKDIDPASWADAVEVDAAIRTLPRITGEAFLHRSLTPLPLVDLSTPQDHGQLDLPLVEECEGVCWT